MATRKLTSAEIERLKRRIAAIPESLRVAARAAVKAEAEKMAANMRRAVPVETGMLRASIRVEDVSDDKWVAKVKVAAGGPTTSKPVRKSKKGNAPLYDYAAAVEFGYREGGKHIPAQPFFYPAVRNRKKAARSAIGRAITKAAKAEAAKS